LPDGAPFVRSAGAADADAVAALLYESAGGIYDRFAGSPERARELLRCGFDQPGTNASAEVVNVAELDGVVAAAMAAFPAEETATRGSAFVRLALRGLPPWRWPAALRIYWAGSRAAPAPPRGALYVDALATDSAARRQGAASALLRHAEEHARRSGLTAVSLDTSLENKPARSLYVGAGYEEVAYRPAGRGMPGFVALVKELS
jgi:ribosomal protein S18 acetylase RimI-like enzyme